jgi:NAD(P)-dependent dehydrogenase (short-subunit alcohol dehydrogenase family)
VKIDGSAAPVTGAASGIGRATAVMLGAKGATLVLADLNSEGAHETLSLLDPGVRKSSAVLKVDLRDAGAATVMVQEAIDKVGRLSILHNNAGVPYGEPAYPDGGVGRIARVVAVDLTATLVACSVALPHMAASGGGVIVNTASHGGLEIVPANPVYAAAKAGIIHFTRSCRGWRRRYGVRVNAVAPGWTATGILGDAGSAGRQPEGAALLAPSVIADAVARLIEDDELAGQCLAVTEPGPGVFR